jgi:hypothetical protein
MGTTHPNFVEAYRYHLIFEFLIQEIDSRKMGLSEIDTRKALAWINKVNSLGKLGKYNEAMRALEIDPKHVLPSSKKGASRFKVDRYFANPSASSEAKSSGVCLFQYSSSNSPNDSLPMVSISNLDVNFSVLAIIEERKVPSNLLTISNPRLADNSCASGPSNSCPTMRLASTSSDSEGAGTPSSSVFIEVVRLKFSQDRKTYSLATVLALIS